MAELSLAPIEQQLRLALLQIIEDRYSQKSVIITSQLPINTLYEYLSDPTLVDAFMDRMSAKSHLLEF